MSDGAPIRLCELLNTLGVVEASGRIEHVGGPAYLERVAVYDVHQVRKMEQAVRKALRIQLKGQGFSLVEILSPCPSNWGMGTQDALDYTKNEMTKVYPLGVFRDMEDKR